MSSNKVLKVLILLVSLTAVIAMACGSADTPTPIVIEKEVIKEVVVVATPTPTPVGGPAPARVSVFRIALGVFGDRIVPPNSPSSYNNTGQIYDPNIMQIKDDQGLTLRWDPGLMREWDLVDGGTLLKVKIGEGVEAHEGWGEYTAQDYEWLHNYYMQQSKFNPRGDWEKWDIGVKATGRYEFEVSRGGGGLLPVTDYLYGMALFAWPMIQKHFESVGEEGVGNYPIGTGPFHFVKWGPGSMSLESVPDHWRGIEPIMDRLEFFHVRESQTRGALVTTGTAHMSDDVNLSDAIEAESRGVKIEAFPGKFNARVIFGGVQAPEHSDDPWSDVRVRKAIALAIDKKAMNDEIWNGTATPLSSPWQSGSLKLDPYPDDLEEAKRLLAEAGYPNGFEVEVPMVTIRGTPRVPKEHNALILALENLGLQVKGTIGDWSTFRPRWGVNELGGSIFAMSVTPFPTSQREWQFFQYGVKEGIRDFADDFLADLTPKMIASYIDDPQEYLRLEKEGLQYLYDMYADVPLYTIPSLQLLAPEFQWSQQSYQQNSQKLRLELLEFAP